MIEEALTDATMTSAQVLIDVGVLVHWSHCSPTPCVWAGILALGGYKKLELSAAFWRSWPGSICGAGRLARHPAVVSEAGTDRRLALT